MDAPIRTAHYALEQEEVIVLREQDGTVVLVPRSLKNATPEKRAIVDELMRAAAAYEEAGRQVAELVSEARDLGVSWDGIGWAVGTTGSASRKRWGVDPAP